jgi:signal transduction histidine kinase
VTPTFYDQTSSAAHGWYAWHWGRGVHLIFWRRLATGHIVGAELDRSRWIADLIAELPQTPQAATPSPQSRIQLVDSHDQAVYQWGAFEPPRDAAPLAELPASAPLSSWRLKFFVAEDRLTAGAGASARFNLIAGLSAIGIVLLVIAGIFYRESSRELREAATRVNFVNQVSHELKTPLTNIRLYAELLDEQLQNVDAGDAAVAHERLAVIVGESGRLSRLIGNVLSFSQEQRRQVKIHPRPGCVDDTIAVVLHQFQPALAAQGVATSFSAGASAAVNFDADAVEQILVNLLSNVEKYAVQGGRLDLASRQDGERTTITVSDAGPGIPPEERDRVFEPFYRLSNRLEAPAGAGIGLSIARGLARLHKGDLRLVDSTAGATFEVDLYTPPSATASHANCKEVRS